MVSTRLILPILAVHLLQSTISNTVDCLTLAEKTADLTVLINETLAINNKSIPEGAQGKLNSIIKDDWTFDMVEYDLMEFLQDLSARYKLNNKTQENSAPTGDQQADIWPLLEAKKGPTSTSVGSTASQTHENGTTTPATKAPTVAEKEEPPTTTIATKLQSSSKESEPNKTSSAKPATPPPELTSTSLASGDHEIAESSWQYGIFDRFTRPRSTTRATTPDPQFTLGPDGKFDVKSFNSDECGLRTYDERKQYFIQQPFGEPDNEATKELLQRRHRLPVISGPVSHKKYQSSISEQQEQQQGFFDRDDQAESDKRKGDKERDAYDSYNKNAPPSSESHSDSDFNLSSRRTWLQQQLGNTLQLLGFNATSQSVAEYLNQTSGLSLNMRENMMKKSAPGKLGKSVNGPDDISTLGDKKVSEQDQDSLNPRQDEQRLEARVIGGSDARL